MGEEMGEENGRDMIESVRVREQVYKTNRLHNGHAKHNDGIVKLAAQKESL